MFTYLTFVRITLILSLKSISTIMEDFTPDEIQQMVSHFKEMGVKPKLDTLQDFQSWMTQQSVTVKVEEKYKPPAHVSASVHHFPKIAHFSGDSSKDVAYDVWKHEVKCIIKESHSNQTIQQAIRSSLRGEALRVHTRLGPSATVGQIIDKFDYSETRGWLASSLRLWNLQPAHLS